MKKTTHPKWYPDAQISCVCGNTFTVGSTKPQIQVEICAACHPFFTGEMRYIDTQGKVEKFQAKQKAAQEKGWQKKKKKEETKEEQPRTLKEMLQKKG